MSQETRQLIGAFAIALLVIAAWITAIGIVGRTTFARELWLAACIGGGVGLLFGWVARNGWTATRELMYSVTGTAAVATVACILESGFGSRSSVLVLSGLGGFAVATLAWGQFAPKKPANDFQSTVDDP